MFTSAVVANTGSGDIISADKKVTTELFLLPWGRGSSKDSPNMNTLTLFAKGRFHGDILFWYMRYLHNSCHDYTFEITFISSTGISGTSSSVLKGWSSTNKKSMWHWHTKMTARWSLCASLSVFDTKWDQIFATKKGDNKEAACKTIFTVSHKAEMSVITCYIITLCHS